MRPTAPFAAFWIIQSPASRPSESSTLIALNGMDPSCAACSSGRSSGTGMSPAAGASTYSAQEPKAPPTVTRRPTQRLIHALADGVHDADGLGAGASGQLGLVSVEPAHGQQIVVVHGREQHPQAHLAGAGLRQRHLLHRQDLGGIPEGGVDECAHGR